jgi:ubiquinone/menaquinone biosynthesis C-methylase UbiE
MAKKYTVLETWIVNETKPEESNSAEQTFDRLETQSGGKLPVIDVGQDFRKEEHFYDEAQVRDFAAHLVGASEVLDIGFGDGWPLLRLAPLFNKLVGIEQSERRLERAKQNAERLGIGNVEFRKMSATAMEFEEGRFGGVVAGTSIEQCPDPHEALREAFRVLKPGGRMRVYFEAYDRKEKGVSESLFLTENEDALGYHYTLTHARPPWERAYLVKFDPTPEMKEEFRKLADLIERLGPSPAQNPELGLQFLERNRAAITGSSWYELEHFTSITMKETLEEIGFVNVRISWSAATLARTMWPAVRDSELTDSQVKDVLRGLADVAVRLEAAPGTGEPVVATKPN